MNSIQRDIERILFNLFSFNQKKMVFEFVSIPGHTITAAKTKAGKTHFTRYMLKELWLQGKFSFGVVISATSSFSGDWDCVPAKWHIHPRDAEAYLEKLMATQASLRKQGQIYQGFVVIDDSIGCIPWSKPWWLQFFSVARQHNLSIFAILQYLVSIPPSLRGQSDQLIFLKLNSEREFKNCYESSFSHKMKYPDFLQFMNKYTEKQFSAILCHNSSSSNNFSDIYKVMVAPRYTPFRMEY